MSIDPVRPIDGEHDFPVVVQGSGPRGIICARVKAFDSRKSPPEAATNVFARIYDSGATIPSNHPDPGADVLVATGSAESNNVWFFSSIPNALPGASPGTRNCL